MHRRVIEKHCPLSGPLGASIQQILAPLYLTFTLCPVCALCDIGQVQRWRSVVIEHSSGVRLPGVRCHAAIHSPRSSASPIVKREQCNGGTDASVAARVCRDSAGSRPVTVPGSQHKRDMNGSSRCHNGLNLDLGFQGHLLEGAVCSQPKNGVKVEGTTRRKALRQEGGSVLGGPETVWGTRTGWRWCWAPAARDACISSACRGNKKRAPWSAFLPED